MTEAYGSGVHDTSAGVAVTARVGGDAAAAPSGVWGDDTMLGVEEEVVVTAAAAAVSQYQRSRKRPIMRKMLS